MHYPENAGQKKKKKRLRELNTNSYLLFMLMSPFMNAFEYIKILNV